METTKRQNITVNTQVNASPLKVWKFWTEPKHITKWNYASEDWHTPHAESDLRPGGKLTFRMEAKNGSNGFDFSGVYDKVDYLKGIDYTIEDGRKVNVQFESDGNITSIKESFEAEEMNSPELQKSGWQAILDNFKKYVEATSDTEKMRFEITIEADIQKVYTTMIDKDSYIEWTSIFNTSSNFIGNWEKGSKVLFVGEDADGNQGGMVSIIKDNIPNKYICIEHIGIYKNGEELTSGAEVEDWAGATEEYSFHEVDGSTLVVVELDGITEYMDYFTETWPKALRKLKEICER